MTDFLHHLMHPLPNAVMTAIMGVLVLYWLFVFITGAGVDDLDFDFDVDVPEPDAPDVEADVSGGDDAAVPQESSPGFFVQFLTYMNVGRVPFMLILSTWKFFTWIGSLITTQLVDVGRWGAWSLLILLPLLLVALLFTKLSTNPLVKFFKAIGYKGEEEIDFLGRSGKMLSSIKDDKIGCAEFLIDKNPIKLNVRSMDGEELKYGEYVVVSDESEDKKIYLVTKEISIRNF